MEELFRPQLEFSDMFMPSPIPNNLQPKTIPH